MDGDQNSSASRNLTATPFLAWLVGSGSGTECCFNKNCLPTLPKCPPTVSRAPAKKVWAPRAPEDLRETRRAAMKLLTWAVLVAPAWGAEAPCAKTGVAYEAASVPISRLQRGYG